MTAQDSFPKVPGDILYDTEVNRFAYAPRFILIGSGPNLGSTTNVQTLGSILINTGSVSNPCQINIESRNDKADTTVIYWTFSGAQGNQTVSAGSGLTGVNTQSVSVILGSPFMNKLQVISMAGGLGDAAQGQQIQKNVTGSSHFNTGSPFVIFWNILNGVASGNIWSVQAFRGNLN